MPELAEVEYYRRQWDAGIGDKVLRVALHSRKRLFRGANTRALKSELIGARLTKSEARGKRMLFRFSGDNWLGLHLGMSGKMSVAGADHRPGKHEHLVLYQRQGALVFRDARMFGRIQFHHGAAAPGWWDESVPEIGSRQFTRAFFDRFLSRHRKAPIKAVLLMQRGFSGVGNWMADEILWRARILPSKRTSELKEAELTRLYREAKYVARHALRIIGHDFSDPPKTWLIHERWRRGGECPRDGTTLKRSVVGGRTTAWCPKCQR